MEQESALFKFIRSNFGMNEEQAQQFVLDFRYYDAIDYGRNIVQNHAEQFVSSFNIDEIDDIILAQIAINVEDITLSETGEIEFEILESIFGNNFKTDTE